MSTAQDSSSFKARASRLASSRARASDWVFDDLADQICRLQIRPGSSVSESELAARYGVSRTPIRAAIAALADIGLVQVLPQVGSRVSLLDLDEVGQAQFVRESLEINALRYACAAEERDFTRIRSTLAEQERAVAERDQEGFFLTDEAFHHQIFDLAGYSGAWAVTGRSRFQLDRIRRLSLEVPSAHSWYDLHDEHSAIVEHIERRDLERAIEVLRAHIRSYIVVGPALREAFPAYFA